LHSLITVKRAFELSGTATYFSTSVFASHVDSKGIVTVLGPDGAQLRVIEAKPGSNLRKTLQASKIDVYDLMGKMTNCNG